MRKSSSRKTDTRKTRNPPRKAPSKVAAEKMHEAAQKAGAEKARQTHRKSGSRVAAEKTQAALDKIASKDSLQEARTKIHKVDARVNCEAAINSRRESVFKDAAEWVRHTDRKTNSIPADMAQETYSQATNQFEHVHTMQVPDSMRALAERNIAQTRELYERSTKTLTAALESWEDSLDAVGQEAVALNRKIIDIAERNIGTSFDLAMSLAGAKTITEVMEVQVAYFRKQFGELKMQAEEVRALLQKAAVSAVERSGRR